MPSDRTLLNGSKRAKPNTRKVTTIIRDDHCDTDVICSYRKASTLSIGTVMGAEISDDDGYTRSEWKLFRLANGDLIFGCFPQDECYSLLEKDASF